MNTSAPETNTAEVVIADAGAAHLEKNDSKTSPLGPMEMQLAAMHCLEQAKLTMKDLTEVLGEAYGHGVANLPASPELTKFRATVESCKKWKYDYSPMRSFLQAINSSPEK